MALSLHESAEAASRVLPSPGPEWRHRPSTRYFNPAGLLTALSGIGLVVASDAYDWSDTFVSIGIAVVIAAGLIGALVHRPGGERIITALESGDRAAAARDGKKAAIWGAVTIVLLIVAVVVMVLKTGAG